MNRAAQIPQWFAWNGSKRWLIEHIAPVVQNWTPGGLYYEPFVGGGCVSSLVRSMFPATRQRLSDANPWLVSAFQSQLLRERTIARRFVNVKYWRGLKDADLSRLSTTDRANRFAICLLTAWGNRWKTKEDGSMGDENPINPAFAHPVYLKRKLQAFSAVKWLNTGDTALIADWKSALRPVRPGDLVFIDPPYPETLGFGNQVWSFSDQLDVVDWATDAAKRGVNVVVSNMEALERLYRRAGFKTTIVVGPKKSKTRIARSEVLAWSVQ